ESVYGYWSAEAVRDGATFLAVITNDGWWGDTPGYHQHFRFAALRAIENRRDVAHVANTGISGFINQRGDVLQATGWWVETAIRGDVHTNTRLTFFSRHGDLVGRASQWLSAGLILLLLLSLLWDRISGRGKSAAGRL
ncbi:MAG: apolipoprotein N-acyltransferase, partial [Bacteroidales bacterium]|nr:apolipoprotein N-acyltransferase [Bacteroidales bacterium]